MPEKRQRVLEIISKTNYQPNRVAKSLRTKKTNIIGVLVEDILSFPASHVINGISEYVDRTDYHILLNDLRMMESLFNKYDQVIHQKDKINQALSFLIFGAKVDAVIYIGMFDRDISGVITEMNKPVIMAYSTSSDEHICSVSYENEEAAAELARHLIGKGHRKIAVITGLAHTAPAQMRLKGINGALKEAGLVLDSTLVKNGDWERSSGYMCMKDLLKSERDELPTAVLAMNDLMAVGAMDAIRESGLRVPEDVSVAGFDNRDVSEFVFPKLTTVEIDLKAIGFAAAKLAVQKLSGDSEYEGKHSITIPSGLLLRSTVQQI
jgi:LacI family transcriptional regulator